MTKLKVLASPRVWDLACAAMLGYLISLFRDLFTRREHPKAEKVAKTAE